MSPRAEGERPTSEPVGFFGARKRKKKRRDDSTSEDACPYCHTAEKVVPIYYGEPTEDASKKSHNGELVLGGIKNPDGRPRLHCKECGLDF